MLRLKLSTVPTLALALGLSVLAGCASTSIVSVPYPGDSICTPVPSLVFDAPNAPR